MPALSHWRLSPIGWSGFSAGWPAGLNPNLSAAYYLIGRNLKANRIRRNHLFTDNSNNAREFAQ